MDIGTGYLFNAGRFILSEASFWVVAGSGFGTSATFDFFTGYNGIGDIINNGGALSPGELNTSSGVSNFIAGAVGSSYINASQIVVRQMVNAGATGNVAVKLIVSPLP